MGSAGNGNGGTPPEGGGRPDGVPDLPPEWGTVVIPDDPSELAEESAAVRKDLRRQARRDAWRRWVGRPAHGKHSPLRIPLLIMAVAVVATLTSLFAVTWPDRQPVPPPATRHSGGTQTPSRAMPALDLIDVDGSPVSLRGLLPAAVILIDGCECARLVADTAAAAKPGVTVVTVTKSSAPPPRASTPRAPGAGAPSVRTLADPTGELRSGLQLGTQGTGQEATVLLVARTGEIISTVQAAQTIDQFRDELAKLG